MDMRGHLQLAFTKTRRLEVQCITHKIIAALLMFAKLNINWPALVDRSLLLECSLTLSKCSCLPGCLKALSCVIKQEIQRLFMSLEFTMENPKKICKKQNRFLYTILYLRKKKSRNLLYTAKSRAYLKIQIVIPKSR